MNTKKLLATFAILASCAANAVTVNFTTTPTVNTPPSGDASYTAGSVTVTGYVWNTNNLSWSNSTVIATSNGIGVAAPYGDEFVTGLQSEYLLLDFAGGTTTVSSAVLNIQYTLGSPTTYFTYAWIASPPVSSSPPVPLAAFSSAPTSGASPGVATFDVTSTGSGRYLLLGATRQPSSSAHSSFAVQSLTYSTVPDGASTLALMGVGIATLGLASRRRRA